VEYGLNYKTKENYILEHIRLPASFYIKEALEKSDDEKLDISIISIEKDSFNKIPEGYFIALSGDVKYIFKSSICKRDQDYFTTFYQGVKIIEIPNKIFLKCIDPEFKKINSFISRYTQIFHSKDSNAYILSSKLIRVFIVFFFALCNILLLNLGVLFEAINLVFISHNIYKFFLFYFAIFFKLKEPQKNKLNKYPIYTILLPLYKEAAKVKNIIDAIEKLDYPRSKLDVKIIIEADDVQTRKAIAIMKLPSYYHLVLVPPSHPRTKPKACNYALNYACGEYCVIYDAEDRPDGNQLINAVLKFNEGSEDLACIQARLKIRAKENSLLTNLFMFEYDLWFKYILYSLTYFNLPIMLGGTSNHFKTKILRQVGCWDPYNVTEDADIGIKLSTKGYKVGYLDSETSEDCPISLKSWFKQRTRWIKGYIITYLIYLFSPKENRSLKNIFSITMVLLFGVLNFIFVPIVPVIFYYKVSISDYNIKFCIINSASYFIFFWSLGYLFYKQNNIKTLYMAMKVVFVFPFYFLLHTIATYLALAEFLFTPFRWNKTDHSF
jgi:glycosyltransferase XagB